MQKWLGEIETVNSERHKMPNEYQNNKKKYKRIAAYNNTYIDKYNHALALSKKKRS